MYSCGPQKKDGCANQDDQHGLTYSNYVRTQDVTLKTCRRRWNDREKWRERVRDIRAGGATWWWWWFDCIHREKMEQLILAYGPSKETVLAIMMFYTKHQGQSLLTGWRHRRLQHCCWSFERKYIITLSVYNLLKKRTSNVNRSKRMQTTQMI